VKFKLKDVEPNPFRHLEKYPIDRDKVKALRESIQETSFWDNIVARKRDGKAEIAYGHHRLTALREEFGPSHEIDLIVRPLTDEQMVKIMARENLDEWASSASVMMETVRVIVEGYANGKWELPKPKLADHTKVRSAPFFLSAPVDLKNPREGFKPYTVATLAEFSGVSESRVEDALYILAAEEEKLISSAQIKRIEKAGDESVGTRTVRVAVEQARRMARAVSTPAAKKAAAERVIDAITKTRAAGGGRSAYARAAEKVAPKRARAIDWEQEWSRLESRLIEVLPGIAKDLDRLIPHVNDVDPGAVEGVLKQFREISASLGLIEKKFQSSKTSKTKSSSERRLLTAGA
jgi:ParB-like chromosome segregation protein Spo0J